MRNIYVVTDTVVKADVFVFLELNDGSAKSFFYHWCLQRGTEYSLSSIGVIDNDSGVNYISDIERHFICDLRQYVNEEA